MFFQKVIRRQKENCCQVFRIILILLLVSILGCTSLQTVKESRGKGVSKTYVYPYDKMYKYARDAVWQSPILIKEESKKDGYIYAEGPMTDWSAGEWVGVFLYRIADDTTRVEIVSKKKLKTNLWATDWTKVIFGEIDRKIKIEQKGD